MTISDSQFQSPEISGARVTRLIYGRLLAATVILGASWFWEGVYLSLGATKPVSLIAVYGAIVLLTAVYEVWRRLGRNYGTQAKVQIWLDIPIIAAAILQTSGYNSPYVTLFIIATSVAGYFLSRIETVLYSASATFAFLLTVLITNSEVIASEEKVRAAAMQSIAFTTAGILFVGLLAARLADKRGVGKQLLETVESLADMRNLHERIVESIGSGLITTDLAGNIYAFNHAAQQICGIDEQTAKGRSVFEILGEDARAPFELSIGAAGGKDFGTSTFETKIRSGAENTGSGETSVTCAMSPLIGRSKQVTGVIIAVQDMTAIRAMEETLRRSDRLAAVGRMSAGLAHEIRNPLGSMSAALQFLKEKDTASAEDKELLEVALRESERLEQIISNFLAYARPNNPVYAKEGLADTDLAQAIRDCVSLLEHSPERTVHHSIKCELPDSPVVVRANESQIKQVFWNLSRNSMQAMPDGGELNVRLNSTAGRNVTITFEDTGRGIGREQLDKIFEPFSDGAKGTGLGLSIVHKIVTEHGGRIDIESKINEGTKVTVELPK